MSASNLKWLAQSTIYRDSVDLLAVQGSGDYRFVLQPVVMEMKKQEDGAYISEPSMALSPQSARSLMQALWDAGIRPETHEGGPAEVSALKAHIQFAEHVARALLPAPIATAEHS